MMHSPGKDSLSNLSAHPVSAAGRFYAATLLRRYSGPYLRRWILAANCTFLSIATALLQPWPMQVIIDRLSGAGHANDGFLQRFTGDFAAGKLIACAALAALLIYLIGAAIEVILTRIWIGVGQRMVYDLSNDLFHRMQRRSLLFHNSNAVGDLMGRVLADSWCVYKLLDSLLLSPLKTIILICGMAFVMYRVSPLLMCVAMITAPIMAAATLLLGKPVRSASREQLEHEMQMQSHVQRTLTGLSVIQSFVQEDREQRRFRDFAGSLVRARQKTALLGGFAELSTGLANVLGTAVVLYVGAHQVLRQHLSLGELLVFLTYLGTLQLQFKSFATTFIALQTVGVSIARVRDLLDGDSDLPEQAGAISLTKSAGHIQIRDAWFGYGQAESAAVLRGVSLEARPGELIAIVGPTGAGKSTLVGLVPRVFDPQNGSVWIDGHDIRDLTIASLRNNIAVVSQEPVLLPMTIAENIAFGRPDASSEQIIAAARAAEAHEFIEHLPSGYQTIVGQRGATLSGGQRQRIAIARAILKDAPILLLDEPTSGLDAATESAVLIALDRLMAGRTVIVIAHRLSTIRSADTILVLEDGQVVERGPHDALIAFGKRYATFHAIQSHSADAAAREAARPQRLSASGL